MVVASLVQVKIYMLNVKCPKVAMQTQGNDCGLYAIAYATALAFGRDPLTQVFIPRLMGSTKSNVLKNNYMEGSGSATIK